MNAPLLVELLTEELPPKALKRLSTAFAEALVEALRDKAFTDQPNFEAFATPRRLAVLVPGVLDKQKDRVLERKGPSLAMGLDDAGKPTPALIGFAKSCGVDPSKLERRAGDKGEYFVSRVSQKGELLKAHLASLVEAALKRLPIPKLMRWGDGAAQFVRPVHGVILLHGQKVVPGTVLGLKSSSKTLGHRFLSKGPIALKRAVDYAKKLKQAGHVTVSFEARRSDIVKQLNASAKKVAPDTDWNLGSTQELLDEVTALVEHPEVLAGVFDEAFLALPKECLIISMQQHQRYFPLVDKRGKLLPHFLFVANIKATNSKEIIHGNERVLRARLSDARFFFDQDRKIALQDRVPRLAQVVYHNKLGSQLERVERLKKIAAHLAPQLKVDPKLAERAAYLSKADLLTEMVGEFPELQGIMGRYYAVHDGETKVVAEAVEQHYWPRMAGGALPQDSLAVCVALADKLDTLVGLFGIGQAPTGEKDPFGLRRAGLGVVRLLIERSIPLDVTDLIHGALQAFPPGKLNDRPLQDLPGFLIERLKPYLRDKGFDADEIEAVLSLNSSRLDQLLPRLSALKQFRLRPEAQALAAANKRIRNILRQAGQTIPGKVEAERLQEPVERTLYQSVQSMENEIAPLIQVGNYTDALTRLAGLRGVVDGFFDQVMVMADDMALRTNRLALLNRLGNLFLHVADISKLPG